MPAAPSAACVRPNRLRGSTLKTDTIKKLIDAAACRGFQAISFTGGEPLLDLPRLVELIRYAGGAGIPFIRTGTNGFMLANPEKKGFEDRISRMVDQLADSPLRNFWISWIPPWTRVHEAMRGFPRVVAGIAEALPIFHQAGIYPAVNLGINRNVGGDATRRLHRNDFGSDRAIWTGFTPFIQALLNGFYQRAIDLGFTMANTCFP